MTKSKSNWMQKTKVRMKVLMPTGVKLTPSETVALAEIYKEDVGVIKKNKESIVEAMSATTNLTSLTRSIEHAKGMRSKAAGYYKATKDPIRKREWARRVVIADQTIKTSMEVKSRMSSVKERLTMIKGDVELELMTAEAKAFEMRAYAEAGKGLMLVGEKLIQARSRASRLRLEYDNLEVSMEGAEKLISGLTPTELALEAERIIGTNSHDS